MDGGLFNVRRFQAKTKVTDFNVMDLLFADDAAIVAHDPVSLQRLLNNYLRPGRSLGLKSTQVRLLVYSMERSK